MDTSSPEGLLDHTLDELEGDAVDFAAPPAEASPRASMDAAAPVRDTLDAYMHAISHLGLLSHEEACALADEIPCIDSRNTRSPSAISSARAQASSWESSPRWLMACM